LNFCASNALVFPGEKKTKIKWEAEEGGQPSDVGVFTVINSRRRCVRRVHSTATLGSRGGERKTLLEQRKIQRKRSIRGPQQRPRKVLRLASCAVRRISREENWKGTQTPRVFTPFKVKTSGRGAGLSPKGPTKKRNSVS